MSGRPFHIISVGKLKQPFTQEGCEFYAKRVKQWRELYATDVRDSDSNLPIEQKKAQEGERIVKAFKKDAIPILLDETGQSMTSKKLAQMIAAFDAEGFGTLTFILGGPFGVSEHIKKASQKILALSSFTLPHELARLFLYEQLYRAETILKNMPYHHE